MPYLLIIKNTKLIDCLLIKSIVNTLFINNKIVEILIISTEK